MIERSPADIWLSILAITFVVRSVFKRDGTWLSSFWVRASFLFLAVCVLSSAMSTMPSYAFSEAIAWFRFPLFAMATAFWLGSDKRLLYGMLISTALGMFLMTGILTVEIIVEGQKDGRLSWPYDDLVSGNYLSKVGLPAFATMVALAIGARPRLASVMGGLSLISIIMSVLTGERINFLIRACSGMLAALVWRPNWRRYTILIIVEIVAIASIFLAMPNVQDRFTTEVLTVCPRAHTVIIIRLWERVWSCSKHLPSLVLDLPRIVNYALPFLIKIQNSAVIIIRIILHPVID